FSTTHDEPGRPDGATVDAEGCYWSAHVDGWALLRYAPDGTVVQRLIMPVQKPSMPAFAGDGLDMLYVTSIGRGGTTPMADGQPMKGGLLALSPGVRGLPEPRFAA
ncbi:MAG: SMP-30/gluconolactonase/LRE family protein, partial [Proteobacteria bacterium]|nr:SMP-30/gluconolactonase/LRE family protein [Pseudomonadota bacterium]